MRGDIERRIDILVTQMSTRLSAGLKSRLNAWPIQTAEKLRPSIHYTSIFFGESKRIDR